MKINFWVSLSLQVMAVFLTAMVVSFIPESIPKFFGDEMCPRTDWHSHFLNYEENQSHIAWGYRHYLFFFMGIALFILQIFRIGAFINNNTKSQ